MRYLVTGAAGFIGFHMCSRLSSWGYNVVGFDNLNDYYDPRVKAERLDALSIFPKFSFIRGDLKDKMAVEVAMLGADKIIHLGAQAGVGYSATNPQAYVDSNITGFLNVLEAMRKQGHKNLLYASSSSVYGNAVPPWRDEDTKPVPTSFYGATKLMNEQMAMTYWLNYQINSIGMRFFTVYGPWGRPDMAMWKFLDALTEGTDIYLYGHGRTTRDLTYIDDCCRCIEKLLMFPDAGAQVVNIGSDKPYEISYVLQILEKLTGEKGRSIPVEKPSWDIQRTHASVTKLLSMTGMQPSTPLECGLQETVKWYLARKRRMKEDCARTAQQT
jgi:UDP-glucuronate 4-epimerase